MRWNCRECNANAEGGREDLRAAIVICSERETSLLQPDFPHQQTCEGWLTRPITPPLRVKRQRTRDERFAPSHANGSTRRLGLALALTEAAVGCFPPKTIQPLACFRPHTPLANNNFPSFELSHQTHPSTTTTRVLNLLLLLLFSPAYRHLVALPHETHTPPTVAQDSEHARDRTYRPPADFSRPLKQTRVPRVLCVSLRKQDHADSICSQVHLQTGQCVC